MDEPSCPVCGSARWFVDPSERWEECSACGAKWVHRESHEGMVIWLPSDRGARIQSPPAWVLSPEGSGRPLSNT
jgi:hypothetical protein